MTRIQRERFATQEEYEKVKMEFLYEAKCVVSFFTLLLFLGLWAFYCDATVDAFG
jgi:hypothetical protein